MRQKHIDFIGVALGWGAGVYETARGPETIQQSGLIKSLQEKYQASWYLVAEPEKMNSKIQTLDYQQRLDQVLAFNHQLATLVYESIKKDHFPFAIGGDHSMAVGTWSGLISALHAEQKFGLIWFDAHMDSHTPDTTPSGNIHGMPLAALLGYGEKQLVTLSSGKTKLNPSHVVLIGVRSYEKEEAALLQKLKVKVYSMEEIRERGMAEIFKEALQIVTQGTNGFGISLDVDAFDPQIAMGTGTPEKNGLLEKEVCAALKTAARHPQFKGIEIAEFNPARDVENRTLQLMQSVMLSALPEQ